MQWPRHPALWDPVCFTDQWTQSLLISSVPLTETGSTHSSHTHIYTNSSYTPTPHTHTHTYTHKLLTHSSHTHTLTHSSYTLTHASQSHTHTHSTHTQPHTLLTHPLTHTHTLLTLTHTHTNTNTEPTGAYTQETWGPRGSAQTPGTWSMWEQPRVPAEVSSWSFHTLGATGP